MIDSHCHLDHPPLYEKLSEVVNRAQLIGIKFFLTISTSLKSFETVKTIISKYFLQNPGIRIPFQISVRSGQLSRVLAGISWAFACLEGCSWGFAGIS